MAEEKTITKEQDYNVVAEEVAKEEALPPKEKKVKIKKETSQKDIAKKEAAQAKAKKEKEPKSKNKKADASKEADAKVEAKKAKTKQKAAKKGEEGEEPTLAEEPKKATKTAAPKKAAPKRRLSAMEIKKREALKGYKHFTKVRNRYYSFLNRTVKQSKPTTNLFNTIANKAPTLSGITRNEVKRFDPEFIEKIERVIPSLEEIVVNPHKFINEFSEVVQVEKARKLTPRAVKFMAQNADHISEVLDDGRVVPKKILNVYVDDDLKIYENRFIMTLINRLQIFIELRHKYIREHGDTRNSDQISIKREVKIEDALFTVDATITMSVPSDDEGARESNNDLLERLENIRRRTQFLVNSRFMREMARAVPVADPIAQTNIIRLNWAYQDAFKLWNFIHRYEELGISYTTTQGKIEFDKKYLDKINQFSLNSFFMRSE